MRLQKNVHEPRKSCRDQKEYGIAETLSESLWNKYHTVKKFFILKNAAALRTLFFETCNCARFRAISYVMKTDGVPDRSKTEALKFCKISNQKGMTE